jgi:hypothetical protein
MGLGSLQIVSLQEARHKAQEARRSLFDGMDPIDARRVLQQSSGDAMTFQDAALRYISADQAGWKSAKHAAQWGATLEAYAFPIFGAQSVKAVDVGF